MIELVIFDLDGTLVRLPVRYDLLRNKLKEKFNIEGEFFIIPTILSKTKGNDELKKEAFEFICNEECNAINELEIYEGVIKIIKEIHSKDCVRYTSMRKSCNNNSRNNRNKRFIFKYIYKRQLY